MVPLSSVVDVRQSVQPNALTSFQQLNSAMLQGVPFPGRTVGEVIDFLKAKSKEVFPESSPTISRVKAASTCRRAIASSSPLSSR